MNAPGEVRRFLTGPTGCEITAATWTPDFSPVGRSRSATVAIRKDDGGRIGA